MTHIEPSEIEKFISKFHDLDLQDSQKYRDTLLGEFQEYIENSHYRRRKHYLNVLEESADQILAEPFFRDEDYKLNFAKAKRKLIGLGHIVLEENKKVFIVHGRDTNMRDKVDALLGRLKIDNVILENEANTGSVVIEKFLSLSEDCRYAIVLMSPDDEGGLVGGEMKKRARQNVIIELGFFLGRLGRKRIMILHTDEVDIEMPSDFHGMIYLPFDNKGAWKHKVIKELRASGFYLDENDVNRI